MRVVSGDGVVGVTPVSRLKLLCRGIHFMLWTTVSHVLLELISSLRHIQSPDASEDSYPTLWQLSGQDFHQLVNDSFRTNQNNASLSKKSLERYKKHETIVLNTF